jgi:hypothetical protein
MQRNGQKRVKKNRRKKMIRNKFFLPSIFCSLALLNLIFIFLRLTFNLAQDLTSMIGGHKRPQIIMQFTTRSRLTLTWIAHIHGRQWICDGRGSLQHTSHCHCVHGAVTGSKLLDPRSSATDTKRGYSFTTTERESSATEKLCYRYLAPCP